VPVPSDRPSACDGTVLPVRELSHLGGAKAAGGETPVSIQFFKNSSPVPGDSLF